MRVNEEEVHGVSDTLPPAVKTQLKRKRSISEVLADVSACSSSYKPLSIPSRSSTTQIPPDINTPESLFALFITPAHFQLIACHTNINGTCKQAASNELEGNGGDRPWHDTTGPEIGVFIGALLLQGESRRPKVPDYWNTDTNRTIHPAILNAISVRRWEQIKRYLKISNPTTDLDSTGPNWYAKVEPLYSEFVRSSLLFLIPGRDVSVDEQLILFKGRSKHAMNMVSKAAGYGFKIYSLCVENYLYNFLFTSKKSKISLLERTKGFSDSSSVVIQLCKSLPKPYNHVVYMDNFFTNVKLYTALKELGIGACGTAKNGSGFPPELLTLREVLSKKNDWGIKAFSTVEDSVLCLAWQDNNTVQLMTTVHTPKDMEASDLLPKSKRHGIPVNSSHIRAKNLSFYTLPSVFSHSQPCIEQGLPFPTAVRQYNKNMGGSDGNAQVRAYYSSETRSFCYWWCLFKFLLDASILNAYTLWKLQFPDSKLSHVDFQYQVAMSLIQNPAGTGRKRATIVQVIGRKDKGLAELEHDWVLLQKRAYCQICCVNKDRPLRERKRKPLGEIEGNVVKRPRQRGPQTLWGCKGCPGSACCQESSCWEALHS